MPVIPHGRLRLGRSQFQASPGKKPGRPHVNGKKCEHAVIPATAGSLKWEDQGPGQPGQKVRPYVQNNQNKMHGGVTQAEHLPSRCKSLNSNPSRAKKKRT
jgi:hypothetical protein